MIPCALEYCRHAISPIDRVGQVAVNDNNTSNNKLFKDKDMDMQELLYQQLLERNARETIPFRSIHESNARLWQQIDGLQHKLVLSEREISKLHQNIDEISATGGSMRGGKSSVGAAAAALKNETRLRDKLEKLQEEYNEKLKSQAHDQAAALKVAKELSELKDLNKAQESTIAQVREEKAQAQRAIEHLQSEVREAKSRTDLAEKQYKGLKLTIRTLQEENDAIQKENRTLEMRLLADKGKLVDEMNVMAEMVDGLKREVDMLRSLKGQEDKRLRAGLGPGGQQQPSEEKEKKWSLFGSYSHEPKESKPNDDMNKTEEAKDSSPSRKFGVFGVIVPTSPKHIIPTAHSIEGTCVRYDGDIVVTASSDASVKLWDTQSGTVRSTFRGSGSGGNSAILACDVGGGLVVGGGTDKTCRVWNIKTDRMLHHLVGHQHKISCVRLFNNGKCVLTGSADRSLKVWDISRTTYKQMTTLRHGSTPNCADVGTDSVTAVSGHMDGGLRFWDLRTGERTSDISGTYNDSSCFSTGHGLQINGDSYRVSFSFSFSPLFWLSIAIHESGITSVHFSPVDSTTLLTNGMDSCLKLIDIRTCTAVHTLRGDADFSTSQTWSKAVLSPDGRYAAAGSSSTGCIFIWDLAAANATVDGAVPVVSKLSGHHTSGVSAIDWGRGGSTGQQVSTIDRRGTLILWS
jgi:autophagy-related protein 16-1